MKKFEQINEAEIELMVEGLIIDATDIDGNIDLEKIEEGIFGKIAGGVAGFAFGPSVGKIIAKALGITKGVFYDLLTSRLVGTALGASLTSAFGKKK